MWFGEDSDSDDPQHTGPMSGQLTEKNPNNEQKDKCNCSTGCSTRSCACFKFASGCNPSCGYSSSCQNMFNHLDYFFGEEEKCTATPCFSHWLIKTAKNTDGLKSTDRHALYQKIKKDGRYTEVFSEDEFTEWKEKWRTIGEDEKLAHLQEFFRMLLSNGGTTYYYSFCHKSIF